MTQDQIIPVCTGAFLCSEIAGIGYGPVEGSPGAVMVILKNGVRHQCSYDSIEAAEEKFRLAHAAWKAAIDSRSLAYASVPCGVRSGWGGRN